MLLEKLLHDVWEQQLVRPGAQGNSTGCILVSADLCTQASQALMIYEDFSDLVGLHTWNPANEVEPVRLDNPATSVLIEHGIDPSQDYAECLPAEIVDQLERSMRSDLGSVGALIRQEEIYDGLVRPNKLITAWSLSLDELRAKLCPLISECTTNDDLLRAASDPDTPLVASGACQVQVLGRRSTPAPEAFEFRPDDLGRRIDARLWVQRWAARPSFR
jgi:hypothetical protein